jgi:hypothetical protein
MHPLLAFYRGSQPDDRGRFLDDILRRDDAWLESTHDFVQWLFPLREPSRVTPWAPVVDAEVLAGFRQDERLRARLRAAYLRMLAFYGLAESGGGVGKAANWSMRTGNWFTQGTHNDLRITRILKSLCILGLRQEAGQFLACLEGLRDSEPDCGLGDAAFRHWRAALDAH